MVPVPCAECGEDPHLPWCVPGILQKQPNPWTCLPTAFAMVMRVPVESVLAALGREGDDRGFHPQELIELAAWAGCPMVLFEAVPEWHGPVAGRGIPALMVAFDGVIINDRHAAAWINGKVHDPNFTIYDLEAFGGVEIFIAEVRK